MGSEMPMMGDTAYVPSATLATQRERGPIKLHAALARHLIDHDLTVMFGLIGHANYNFVNHYRSTQGGKYIAAAHETGAVQMALGYAIATDRVGLVTVTCGPGLTNTFTPLVEGVRGRIPIVLIAGDTATEDKPHLQDIPQNEVVLPTGAGFVQVRSPRTALADLRTAIRRASVERRPIVLNVPLEFQWADVDYEATLAAPAVRQATWPDPDAIDVAAGILASARRPIVLAGRGAAVSGARSDLLRLAEQVGAPVATTLKGRDLFRGEPFDLGLFGTLSTTVATETILASDCVVAFGASLNDYTTAHGSFLRGKRVIHSDIDAARLGHLSRVDAPVVGDASAVAQQLFAMMDEAGVEPKGFRSEVLEKQLSISGDGSYRLEGQSGPVDIRSALHVLNECFPRDRIVVADGGRFLHQTFARLQVEEPMSFVMTNNFGSIGLGMGHAIGASASSPDRPTLLVTGDGGFMSGGLVELNTAVRYGMDLTVVIMNDGAYGSEYILLRDKSLDPSISVFDWPDFAPVAKALGAQGFTVRTYDDLAALDQAIGDRDGPLLIDIKLDPKDVPANAT